MSYLGAIICESSFILVRKSAETLTLKFTSGVVIHLKSNLPEARYNIHPKFDNNRLKIVGDIDSYYYHLFGGGMGLTFIELLDCCRHLHALEKVMIWILTVLLS